MWLIYLIMAAALIGWVFRSFLMLVVMGVIAANRQRPPPLTTEQKRLRWWQRTFG